MLQNLLALLLILCQPFIISALPPRPLPPSFLLSLHNATHHPHHPPFLLPVPPAPHCTRITTPGTPGLEPTNCELISDRTCLRISLTRSSLTYNKWVWDEMPGCALGYYFPTGAYIPTREECSYATEKLLERCILDSRWNAGSLNVGIWPSFAGDGTAERGRERGGRVVVAPERLTL